MKKVFSLILAVAMVLSLASVAFADDGSATMWDEKTTTSKDAEAVVRYDNDKFYTYDTTAHKFTQNTTGSTTFGKTVYYPLFVSDDDIVATQDKSVASLRLVYEIEEGSAYIDSVSIVKKYGKDTNTDGFKGYGKDDDAFYNGYYIAVATKGSADGAKDISGIISLTGKTGSGSTKLKDEAVHFSFKLAWASATAEDDGGFDFTATGKCKVDTTYVATTGGGDVDFKFTSDVSYAADMVKDEKVVIKFNTDALTEIEDANEEAGIAFYNFNGAAFKRAAYLTIVADDEEPGYLYEILADNSLKDISATYDEEEGGFHFKTKKLGFYCTSDLPLADAEGTVAAAPGAVNPVTGAIA